MKINANEIPERIKTNLDDRNDLFGNQFVVDLRPVAGRAANLSGKALEDLTEHKIRENNIEYTPKPTFHCHFGLSREGDFEIVVPNRKIHIECKQLGNAESHFDKLSHCLFNLISGCYGKDFWLVYDYNANLTKGGKVKIKSLVNRCKEIQTQVALQGITFELVLIDNLTEMLVKTKS